jgi:hypothetical protein
MVNQDAMYAAIVILMISNGFIIANHASMIFASSALRNDLCVQKNLNTLFFYFFKTDMPKMKNKFFKFID